MAGAGGSILSWGSTQSHILTGGGIIEAHSRPGVDFSEEDLPHYLLHKKVVRQTLRKWLDSNLKSSSIIGAWGRPLFSGGWMESTDNDTESFNLQTTSIFIDMRFPTARPTAALRLKGSLASCSEQDLCVLARQHCFSGYSFPTKDALGNEVFTRHHFIDWNFHPNFPRSRPNRWWVQTKPTSPANSADATDSFKEFSVIRDPNNVPVYMERWARREPKAGQTQKYLALRKVRTCPAILKAQGLPPQRDAVLVVVGRHWCLAYDRSYVALGECMQEVEALKQRLGPAYKAPSALGGGPAFVDNLLAPEAGGSWLSIDSDLRRRAAEEYLSLEGSYGVLPAACAGTACAFAIQRSTQPWLEGSALPWHTVRVECDGGAPKALHCLRAGTASDAANGGGDARLLGEWEVLECSFTANELRAIFGQGSAAGPPKLRAKL